jgi:hypothetical protein
MKNLLLCLAVLLLAVGVVCADKKSSAKSQLRHVVCFKFKSDASPEQIQKVEDAFLALKPKISEISSLEWGTNVSPEKFNKGFTHCFLVTFKTEKDRDAYLVHKEHKAFVEVLKPAMEDAFVLDYWAKE